MEMREARYDRGTVLLKGVDIDELAGMKFSLEGDVIRIRAVDWVRLGIDAEDKTLNPVGSPEIFAKPVLRDYQRRALEEWMSVGKGIIVLPTGAGKTLIAVAAICELKKSALILVPTLELVSQWISTIKRFSEDVGEWTGRRKEFKPITVATYDSASLSAEFFGNKFEILVADEVHHLPAKSYRLIAEMSVAPFRMGLTATPERSDMLHEELDELCGDVVFEGSVEDMKGKYLADFTINTIKIKMEEEELTEYRKQMEIYKGFALKLGLNPGNRETFERILRLSGRNSEARDAILAMQKARKVAFNSSAKFKVLKELLDKHKGEKIIIFTRFNDMVMEISGRFLIPSITCETPQDERKKYLEGFGRGKYMAVVSAQVLDEGIDVPDASVGIVLSGTASQREFVQRLGRILRPKPKATLYEVISTGTSEVRASTRRRGKLDAT